MTESNCKDASAPAAQPQTDADWEALRQLNQFELETKEHELDRVEPPKPDSTEPPVENGS